MKKFFNFLLLLTTFVGYLEWAPNNHAFVFQMEADLFRIATGHLSAVVHPLTILPLLGQLLLLITLFQSPPRRWLTYTGLTCTGLLLLLIFITGLLSHNWKITLSVLPYILTGLFVLRLHLRRTA